ncbi:MAG TPA: TIGR02302 family protein [Roseiarcus sp.]|nr:TIGR02302 family protein [Roseiarcus sp.]
MRHPPEDFAAKARERLARLTRRAHWTLTFERAWPPIAAALTIGLIFLAASWFGLWFALPPIGRIIGVALFAAAALAAFVLLLRTLVSMARRRSDALARLDRDSGAPHRPASSSLDLLADPAASEATHAMWRLHQRRLAAKVSGIAVAPPAPRLVERDRMALRLAALVLAVAAAFVAGPEKYARVAAAFDWRLTGSSASGFRLDAWIDPPVFTGKPPIMLDALGKSPPPGGGPVKVETPVGSTLVIRADPAKVTATVEGALIPVETAKPDDKADPKSGGAAKGGDPVERRWTIKGAGKLAIARDGAALSAFDIAGVPTGKPSIVLIPPPRANLRGSLTLRYRTADQYGIAAAEADFAKPPGDGKSPPARTLVEPPRMALELPPSVAGTGEAQTTSDLSEHPWARAKVMMTLRASDVAGEEGSSEPVEVTLPQRAFSDPLAKALVEERRDLNLDPDHNRSRVATALDALLIAPELFGVSSSVYLGLNAAKTRLKEARSDADLIGVSDLLWAMALQIEDGDASQAERDLRAAEQRLREALERGASDDEIRELMKELRSAAENFARELAEKAQNPQGEDQDSNATPLDEKDLESMLDRMEDSARSGDKAEAQAMLDQLQNMFENLRGARRGGSQAQREMRRQLGDLDRLLRDQQKLRDDTFREDQRARRRGQNPGDQGADAGAPPDDQTPLDERQKALRDRLNDLQRRMKGLGLKGEKGFEDAEGAMGEAEGDLKDGDNGRGKAIGAQGRALEALREGAEGLQRQMQGQGQGEGDADTAVEPGEGRHGRDPLGRDPGDFGRGAATGPLGDAIGAAERARRVMEELRRRLSDPNRLEDERDYLERLLNRNLPD